MATGDILSVVIRAEGWSADVTIEGFATGATYNFGLGTHSADTSGSKFELTVVSEGYNSSGALGTVTRKVYGTTVVRLPYPAETNQSGPGTTKDEQVVSGNLVVRIALSDYVYVDDNTGAGKSGTAPTVAIASGWCVNSGGGSQSSAAYSGAVTNNSTETYPLTVCQWDPIAGQMAADRVKADFYLGANARNRHGIACVRFTATGRTSLHSQTIYVTEMSGMARSATGLWANVHRGLIPLSGFTQGELVDCDFAAFPLVGDAASVLDTSSRTTATEECLGYNRATLVCDKSNALDSAVYVATTGNDTTGNGSDGNPYATIAKAVSTSANIVYLKAGSHNLGSTQTRRTSNEWVVVQPAPGESSSTVTATFTTTVNYRCQRLELRGLKLSLAGTTSYASGESAGNFIKFRDCVFDSTGIGKPTTSPGYSSYAAYFLNCTGDLGNNQWALGNFGAGRVALWLDGCELGAGTISAAYRVAACREIEAGLAFGDKSISNIAPTWDNVIFESNHFEGIGATGGPGVSFVTTTAGIDRGVSISGNLLVKTSATSPCFEFSPSNSPTAPVRHVLFLHNTFHGERTNHAYDSAGSVSIAYGLWRVFCTAIHNPCLKTDTFAPGDGARIGNWSVYYGVGNRGVRAEISSFALAHSGIDGYEVGDDAFGFTDDRSNTGAGGGGGNYKPTGTSPLRNVIPAGGRMLRYDLFGNEFGNNGNGSAGAVQRIEDIASVRVACFFLV